MLEVRLLGDGGQKCKIPITIANSKTLEYRHISTRIPCVRDTLVSSRNGFTMAMRPAHLRFPRRHKQTYKTHLGCLGHKTGCAGGEAGGSNGITRIESNQLRPDGFTQIHSVARLQTYLLRIFRLFRPPHIAPPPRLRNGECYLYGGAPDGNRKGNHAHCATMRMPAYATR